MESLRIEVQILGMGLSMILLESMIFINEFSSPKSPPPTSYQVKGIF